MWKSSIVKKHMSQRKGVFVCLLYQKREESRKSNEEQENHNLNTSIWTPTYKKINSCQWLGCRRNGVVKEIQVQIGPEAGWTLWEEPEDTGKLLIL